MARPSSDLFFSQLFVDYLSTDESAAAGVPDIPKAVMDKGTVAAVPALIVQANERNGAGSYRRSLDLVCGLIFYNRPEGDDAADDAESLAHSTLRATAAGYLDLIESRLMDRAAFDAFLATLPDERRDGWRILKYKRTAQPSIEREKKEALETTIFCAFELEVLWHPVA
jgi:hypothetical protein